MARTVSERGRGPEPLHVATRVIAVGASAAAGIAALVDVDRPAVASLAALAVVATLIVFTGDRPTPVARRRTIRALADRLGEVSSVAEAENALLAAVGSLPGVDVEWLALTDRTLRPGGRPRHVELALARAMATLPEQDPTPQRFDLPHGQVLLVPLTASCDEVLAVATAAPLPADDADHVVDIASLTGTAIEALRAGSRLDERRRDARFEELVRFATDAILVVDAEGTVRYATPSVTTVLGHRSADVVGMVLADLVVSGHRDASRTFLRRVGRQDPRQVATADLRFVRADGREIHGEVTGANLLANPDVAGVVVTIRDVTSRRSLENQLRHEASHDALTGLANRSLFAERLDEAMAARSHRGAGGVPGVGPAVVFIDLDDFKHVNDSLGHDAGDLLLRTVAARIEDSLRSTDTAARLGGDEFAAVIPDVPDEATLRELVGRLGEALGAPIDFPTESGTERIEVRASLGVAAAGLHVEPIPDGLLTDPPSTGDAIDADELVVRADLAMYQAKVRGKAQFALYEPDMQVAASDRLTLTAELHDAVDADEFEVHYQPIVDLGSGEIVAVEAFARWPHRIRGMLGPADFLDVAEETGLVLPIGRSVLRQALAALAGWRADVHADLTLNINVSARQLGDPDFEATLLGLLDDHAVPPDAVVLEIHEGVFRSNRAATTALVASLAAHGVRIGLDDFGSDGTALRSLPDLPIDVVKIDRTLVGRIGDPRHRILVESLVGLAAALGVDAVGTGVEDEDEAAALRELGCRLGQGVAFGRPRGPRSVLARLRPVDDAFRSAG